MEKAFYHNSRNMWTVPDSEMSVPGSLIRPVDSVRDLGVLIDNRLTLFKHVNKVAALCYFHIRQLRLVRRTLTDEVTHFLVRALIHNRIDYCNGILASSPKYLCEKLQSGLRVAARLVLRLPSRSPISASIRDQLHWLSVESKVKFKLAPPGIQVGSRSGSGVPFFLLCSGVRACQVAHIFDLLISGPCSSPELRLWQSAFGVFTVK